MTKLHALPLLCSFALACSSGGSGDDTPDAPPRPDARAADARTTDGPAGPDAPPGGPDAPPMTPHPVQHVQDGTVAAGMMVRVEDVFVTAIRAPMGSNVTFYVQEPQGDTVGGHVYPEYAGVAVFLTAAEAAAVTLPAVGDCVTVEGTVAEYEMFTEIATPTITARSACGTAPTPLPIPSAASPMVTFADVTSDGAGGPKSETFEGVLVELRSVRVLAVPDMYGEAPVAEQSNPTGPTVRVDDFFYDPMLAMDQNFASIRGIYAQYMAGYKVQPRSAADLLP